MNQECRVIVCGGRDFVMTDAAKAWLSDRLSFHNPIEVVNGGARGADQEAAGCALELRWKVVTMCADWNKHGRSAGPIRNREMLDYCRQGKTVVLAFPGGKGTADMVAISEKSGAVVEKWTPS